MSYIPSGIASYRQTEVESRTPLELVVMLYDGALRFMGDACDAIERRDIAARRDALGRALAIVAELQNTLNLEAGGEFATALDRLYTYSNTRLLEAAARNDVAPIAEVRQLFSTLRDGWHTISTEPGGAAR